MSACESGEIPLISAKKIDNGVKAFISDNGKKLFEGHILTLNNDGDGGVGIAYYQANKMALDTHVTALIPLIPINRSSLLFISKTITIQRDKFSHGYSLNNNRMKAQKIVLPIDKNGNPMKDTDVAIDYINGKVDMKKGTFTGKLQKEKVALRTYTDSNGYFVVSFPHKGLWSIRGRAMIDREKKYVEDTTLLIEVKQKNNERIRSMPKRFHTKDFEK